jgi:hypothetical protein
MGRPPYVRRVFDGGVVPYLSFLIVDHQVSISLGQLLILAADTDEKRVKLQLFHSTPEQGRPDRRPRELSRCVSAQHYLGE